MTFPQNMTIKFHFVQFCGNLSSIFSRMASYISFTLYISQTR